MVLLTSVNMKRKVLLMIFSRISNHPGCAEQRTITTVLFFVIVDVVVVVIL